MSGRGKKAGAAPRKKANLYKMPPSIPAGEVIDDISTKKKWRIGPSIGVGGFGEIYSACDHDTSPKKATSFPYVIKIEPIENGPLFVEKHFYVRNANKDDISSFMKSKKLSSLGMPLFYGSGPHNFKGEKLRFLVLERYGSDVWKLFMKAGRFFSAPTVFQLGQQMLDVLEYIHSRGYVHADIKGANMLMGLKKGTENQAFLVDFGLASRVTDRDIKPDPKCAHNGTIEYTSRDAHLGMSTMRGDLEILGYNLLQWLVGRLPWEPHLTKPKVVQQMKEEFMNNVRSTITKEYPTVPKGLIDLFEHVNTLKPKDPLDFAKCHRIFDTYLKKEGKTRNSKIDFTPSKANNRNGDGVDVCSDEDVPLQAMKADKPKRTRKVAPKTAPSNDENVLPDKLVRGKRKSNEPALVKVKKSKVTPKATPPAKKNHANTATQTSGERRRSLRNNQRQVSFDSPICEIIGEKKNAKKSIESLNSSRDIFEDSIIEEKVKPKRKLLSTREVIVKRVVKKKATVVATKKGKLKDSSSTLNGSPTK